MNRPPLDLHPSAWFDVADDRAAGHYVHEEGRLLRRMLDQLAERDQDMSQVLVITPFRDVAGRLRGLPERYGKQLRAGTIHTAQGKEADVVFLVLGGNPNRPRAKDWAASPNLINVAASRAKRRLYVIGNHRAWTVHANLKIVAQPPMAHVSGCQLREVAVHPRAQRSDALLPEITGRGADRQGGPTLVD